MTSQRLLLRALADVFLAGEFSVDAIVRRSNLVLGKEFRWIKPLARRFVRLIANEVRPTRNDVARFLGEDRGFRRTWYPELRWVRLGHWILEPQEMRPVAAAKEWRLPSIVTVADLADWFGISVGELEWFAELKNFRYRDVNDSPAAHYLYKFLLKRSGGVRLIEIPKSRIKILQQKMLHEILDRVPPHSAANGFVRGRSIRSFVAPHVKREVVLKMDLSDFFPTFRAARIATVFRMMGYPEMVAELLAGICTNVVPLPTWKVRPVEVSLREWRDARDLYSQPHLPQGAPTSPALANVCCYRMDCRLTGLAESAGVSYTRYADDLAFSGDGEFARSVERFANHAAAILMDEGFRVNFRKTRVMRQGVRQRLVGLTINEKANVPRKEFDRLKAILTNCARYGPESQNREGQPGFRMHLEGRVNFVMSVNPVKGERLQRILEQIVW